MPSQIFAATGIQPYLLTFTMVCSLCESAPITLFYPLLPHIRVTYRSHIAALYPMQGKPFSLLIPLAHFNQTDDRTRRRFPFLSCGSGRRSRRARPFILHCSSEMYNRIAAFSL